MTWTTPAEIKAQVQRLWDRGLLLVAQTGGEPIFPRRLVLRGPDSRELSERFADVRDWIADLSAAAGSYRVEWRQCNHRILGANAIPTGIWVDTLADALALIGRRRQAECYGEMVVLTRSRQPELLPWLLKRPLRALELAEEWPRLLATVDWLRRHPRPGLYLRQIDLPGIHTKWIEGRRGVLAELFDLVLPAEAVTAAGAGASVFCRRYGFQDKPLRVRFRILDRDCRLLPVAGDQDITLTQAAFASLDLPLASVFITENEVNFLAFPPAPRAMVIFGAGYGFDNLAAASWLHRRKLFYWGDIDTHGFAILNQLRGHFPSVTSLLMDQSTLLAHRQLWVVEEQPEHAPLERVTPDENTLYEQLCQNHWGDRVRLEQERIGFACLVEALRRLPG